MKLQDLHVDESRSDDHESMFVWDNNYRLDARQIKNGHIIMNSDFVRPEVVLGYYSCNALKLKSLAGVASTVKGSFMCFNSGLTSLVGGPKLVTGTYDCSQNKLQNLVGVAGAGEYGLDTRNNPQLTSLEGIPSRLNYINVRSCAKLNSLHDIHRQLDGMTSSLACDDFTRQIKSSVLGLMLIDLYSIRTVEVDPVADILNKWKNQGRKGVLGAQRELLDLGYEELARL